MKITTHLFALILLATAGFAQAQTIKPEISTPMGVVTAPEDMIKSPVTPEKSKPTKAAEVKQVKAKPATSKPARTVKPVKKMKTAKKAKVAKK